MYKKTGFGFSLIALILGGCLYFLARYDFKLGIDLVGGTELVYELDLSAIEGNPSLVAEQVKNIVAERLDIYGLKEISIAIQGQNRMVVQVPGAAQDVEQIRYQVEQAGQMDFMLVAKDALQTEPNIKEIQATERRYQQEYRAWVAQKREFDAKAAAEGKTDAAFPGAKPQEPEFIVMPKVESEVTTGPGGSVKSTPKAVKSRWGLDYTVLHNREQDKVSGNLLSRAVETYDENARPAVAFGFRTEGANKFAMLTGPNVGRDLAIALDGKIRQQANIKSKISGSGQLTGGFTSQEVRGIVTLLKGGSLPTKPQLISQSTVGAVLGTESIHGGAVAVAVGLLAIFLFMLIYYMVGGLIADAAMAFNVVIVLAFVLVFRQTLTFPGLAGVLLTIAMAIDANILIFERVREELQRGKSLLYALGAGYDRAFWVIFDSNLTTILTGIVLFKIGSGPVKGFAVTLITGLIASFFTSVFVTRIVVSFLYNAGLLKNLKMMKVFAPPRVDYVAIQRFGVGGSVAVIALTWMVFVFPRWTSNYGIDFTGGDRITLQLAQPTSAADFRAMIETLPKAEQGYFRDLTLQTQDEKDGKATKFILLLRSVNTEGIADAQEKPAEAAPAVPAVQPVAGVLPLAAAPVVPAAASATPAVATVAPAPLRDADQRRVAILRRILKEKALLLPEPYSEPEWKDAGSPGLQGLTLEVNVLPASVDVANAPGLSRAETIKQRLNDHFQNHVEDRFRGGAATDPGAFAGVRIDKVDLASAPGAAIERYRLTTQPYLEPPLSLDAKDRKAPLHQEVVGEIKRWFSLKAAQEIKISEPFPEIFSVGPKVAEDLQRDSIVALFVAMIGIMFYMALRFELMFGIAAIVALVHDVVITIGIMAMTDALLGETFTVKINLPEIAAFLTIVGFSVNDTIVIFDRVREMLATPRRKASFRETVNAAVNQTMGRTIWTSLTTLLVTLSLLFFGGEPIRGFSYAFAIGVVTGCYSTVFIASPVVIWLHDRQEARKAALAGEMAKGQRETLGTRSN